MLRRVTLMLTLATITAVVLALQAGTVPAAPKTSGATEPIRCKAGKVCQGTSGNDVFIGSEGNDNIRPMGGDDKIYANGGDDAVAHSYGKDTIYGGDGADTLRGGFDDDQIFDGDGKKDSTGAVIHDDDHDLLDCAYLTSRGDTGDKDAGYGAEKTDPFPDTVVDCSNRDDQ
jgi:hemolysin type calcium-binding protein